MFIVRSTCAANVGGARRERQARATASKASRTRSASPQRASGTHKAWIPLKVALPSGTMGVMALSPTDPPQPAQQRRRHAARRRQARRRRADHRVARAQHAGAGVGGGAPEGRATRSRAPATCPTSSPAAWRRRAAAWWRRSCRRSPGRCSCETVQALTDALAERGYQLMLGQSGYVGNREDALLDAIIGRRPDGIVLTGIMHSAEGRRRLLAAGIPVVETWDLTPTPIDMLVGFSHADVGRAVAEFLHAKGRRRLAVVTGDDERATRRPDAFQAAARALGLRRGAGRRRAGADDAAQRPRRAGRAAARPAPTSTRSSAAPTCWPWACMTEAQARGIAVPDQLAVVGFGDLEFAADLHPALTTVRIDGAAIGRQAAQFIVDRAEGARRRRSASSTSASRSSNAKTDLTRETRSAWSLRVHSVALTPAGPGSADSFTLPVRYRPATAPPETPHEEAPDDPAPRPSPPPRRPRPGLARQAGHPGRAVPARRLDRHDRARASGRRSARRFGQTFIVDNKAGATGTIGAAAGQARRARRLHLPRHLARAAGHRAAPHQEHAVRRAEGLRPASPSRCRRRTCSSCRRPRRTSRWPT